MKSAAAHKGWTKYHITHDLRGWRFYKEGMKRSIKTSQTRNEAIKAALYRICEYGGLLFVHYGDGSVDFVVDNWCG